MSTFKPMKTVNKYVWVIFLLYIVALICFSLQNKVLYWSNLSHCDFILKSSNLIPFKTIITYVEAMFVQSINLSIILRNLLLPIAAFIPFGFFAHKVINLKKSGWHVLAIGSAFAFVIEILQIVLRRGSFDIDDIILSLIGVLFWTWLYKLSKKAYHCYTNTRNTGNAK